MKKDYGSSAVLGTWPLNPNFKWISWSVPNIYNIGLKEDPNNSDCRYDFKGHDYYYPDGPTKSYANPFLATPYVKKPAR